MEATNIHDRMILSSIPFFIGFYADSDLNDYELDISQLDGKSSQHKVIKNITFLFRKWQNKFSIW